MKRQPQSHRIEPHRPVQRAKKLTPEQIEQVKGWIAAGYTTIEVTRAAFRAWGRDLSPSAVRTYRKAGPTT